MDAYIESYVHYACKFVVYTAVRSFENMLYICAAFQAHKNVMYTDKSTQSPWNFEVYVPCLQVHEGPLGAMWRKFRPWIDITFCPKGENTHSFTHHLRTSEL